jgi:hypothetical protein
MDAKMRKELKEELHFKKKVFLSQKLDTAEILQRRKKIGLLKKRRKKKKLKRKNKP